jgi:hypothetical protein
MGRFATTLIAGSIVAGGMLAPVTAEPQAPVPQNSRVSVEYSPTTKFASLRERLSRRGILEQYSQFLSPLRLKQDLKVATVDCGVVNAFYSPGERKISICYEYLTKVEDEVAVPRDRLPEPLRSIPGVGLMDGFTRAEVIIGGLVEVLLHETGHAVFDIQKVPRLGREEDAADGIAGLIMLQFGKSVALTMIKGGVNVYLHDHSRYAFDPVAMSDVHGLNLQRLYNYLCLAYGSEHRSSFQALADRLLPELRKPNCVFEYNTAKRAFDKTIMPDVDRELLERVRAMQILRPQDLKL